MKQTTFCKSITEYLEVSRQIAELEKKKALLASQLQKDMGESEEVQIKGYTVRYKTIESLRFDSHCFREQYEALYQSYCKLSITKRFTVA